MPRPNEAPYQPIDDANSDENAKDVSSHTAFASAGVEEAVRVEALGGDGDVGKCEIERENDDEEREMENGRGFSAWKKDFDKGEDGVESVLRDLRWSQVGR